MHYNNFNLSNKAQEIKKIAHCTHKNKHMGYGYATKAGFKGLGGYLSCEDCCAILEFDDDIECCTPEEIEHNKKLRKKQHEL